MYDSYFQHALKVMVILTVVLAIVLLGFLAYWQWVPNVPIVTGPNPYRIVYPENKVVVQGGYLTYEFEYNKTSDIMPDIRRQFVDGLVFNVSDPQTATVGEIGEGTARVQIKVPETLPPGTYHLRVEAIYEINPIKEFRNVSITEDFEVVSGRASMEEQGVACWPANTPYETGMEHE